MPHDDRDARAAVDYTLDSAGVFQQGSPMKMRSMNGETALPQECCELVEVGWLMPQPMDQNDIASRNHPVTLQLQALGAHGHAQ